MGYSVEEIEKLLYKYMPTSKGYQQDVTAAMNYAFSAGGKRIRPIMMKMCYDMFVDLSGDYDEEIIAPFMAAIEMIHTYSLIHDDLPALDNDELRRGKPTVHVKFGEDIAILAGDGLLNYAYETCAGVFDKRPADTGVEKAFLVMARKPGIYGMIGGQTLDVVLSGKPVDERELDFIYRNKTSALIECSMMVGAYLAGADEETVKRLEEAAGCVGMAFQVQDDILDIIGQEEKLGKPIHSDEKNDKYTYATIHGIDASKAYVREMSGRADDIIKSLDVKNEKAKEELINLINSLIDRDR
ncbi:MAG: polyprenyl synthetase family protein [Lachnospiraceae bacterium]|nr:polyprenyl synthetase family protein [Lachnospiraceae bacterium]